MSCSVMKSFYLRLLILLRPGHYEGPLRPLQRQLDAVHDKTCQIEYFFSGLRQRSPAFTVFFEWQQNWSDFLLDFVWFEIFSLPECKLIISTTRTFLWSLPKRAISPSLSLSLSQTVLSCFKSCIRAADQRPGLASFIWIFQWWKWKFWPPENLIKFSYLSRCSLSWTTYTFCCYVAKTFLSSKKYFLNDGRFELSNFQAGV